LSEPIIKV